MRVLDVLELLARPGNERLRFSDVARELDLTQATAHAILKTLTDRGWVARDPDGKAFSLGPVLAAVAARAEAVRPLSGLALARARELARRTGYPTTIVERVNDTLVISAPETVTDEQFPVFPGDRIPYALPFGVAFAAWDAPEEQSAWIRRSPVTDPVVIDRIDAVLARTRDRGYDIDRATPALARATQLVGTLERDGLPAHVRQIMDQLMAECASIIFLPDDDPANRTHPIATLSAPVFDHRHRVALLLAVNPMRALTAAQLSTLRSELVEAAGEISASAAPDWPAPVSNVR
ncbi:helix-turn-helix domain-containing protein [Nocardia bovistercoris]|uniref:helix-turn-helix domain-containing protein n=1 Tax=Nocardia bovistercoris TaxID=2785916 RepID=UPI002FCD1878